MDNGLISYYDTPCKSRVRELRLIVLPFKFWQVVMYTYHISLLAGHSHEQITISRILARFWLSMVNTEVAQFIRAYTHCQLVNSFSNEAQQLLQIIDLDTPFDVVFLEFWEPGDIWDQDGTRKILTCLDCMTGFGLAEATGMKEITSTRLHDGILETSVFHLGSPKWLWWMQLDFFWNIQEEFPRDLSNHNTCSCKKQPQSN